MNSEISEILIKFNLETVVKEDNYLISNKFLKGVKNKFCCKFY